MMESSRRTPFGAIGLGLLVAACTPSIDGAGQTGDDAPPMAAASSSATTDQSRAGGERPPPGTFGLGSAAPAELIAAFDIDIGPDGVGLPPGEATVPEGMKLYAARCAVCHGADGTGGPNDVLAGRLPDDAFPFATEAARSTVGNYWPYATTLFDYVRRSMPFDAPGSLSDHEVYASVAAVLYLNDLIAEDAVVDAATITSLVMPARDRFVPDDRAGGAVVR